MNTLLHSSGGSTEIKPKVFAVSTSWQVTFFFNGGSNW